jgi:hypothetical protein
MPTPIATPGAAKRELPASKSVPISFFISLNLLALSNANGAPFLSY